MEHSGPSTLRWRRGLLVACAVGFVMWSLSLFEDSTWRGRAGISHFPTPVAFHDAVTAVVPGSPGATAGIKPGDVFDLRASSAPDRWRARYAWLADRPYTYLLLRGTTKRLVTFKPKRSGVDLSSWSWFIGALGALIFATIIAWRRPWLVEARVLCLLLVVSVVAPCLSPKGFWITPWAALDFGAATMWDLVLKSTVLLVYTLFFGRPLSTIRWIVTIFAFFYHTFGTLISNFGHQIGTWSGAFDLIGGPIGTSALLQLWVPLVFYGSLLLTVALAWAAARGRERSLLVWTTALPIIDFVVAAALYFPVLASNQEIAAILRNIENGTVFLTPFGIGYAILNRRILDIGFVLNQAAIFSGVSIVVVGLFMLGEWVLGSWFGKVTHATNLAMSAALVVALGFSVRAIHSRVEAVFDRVFFPQTARRRNRDSHPRRDGFGRHRCRHACARDEANARNSCGRDVRETRDGRRHRPLWRRERERSGDRCAAGAAQGSRSQGRADAVAG
jgi:hypothetical protein